MKYYDWNEIRKEIEEAIPNGLVVASIGMKEDWFWTGEDVWTKKDGYFNQIDEPKYDKERLIGGIRGSFWATPIIKLIFEQDDFVEKDVYTEGD